MSTNNPPFIHIELIYALPHEQKLINLQVAKNTTIQQAIVQSGILEKYPEINLAQHKIGIFGKLASLDTPLRDRDRIEIYRALIADPKEIRKQRAEQGKKMKKGTGN